MQGKERTINQDYVSTKSQEFIDTCSWFLMRKVVRSLTNFINDSFKESGILSTQLGALAILAVNQELSISEIAKELVMDQTTATRNIQNLEKLQFVTLQEGTDKRVKLVSLTDKGKRKLEEVLPIWDQDQGMLNQALGMDKITSLDSILRQILQTIQKPS